MAVGGAASSSSSTHPGRVKYDVFLSFSGDTRCNFTSHLYAALCRKKIQTYIEDRLEEGYEISQSLLTAIEESMIALIIFSEKYASSRWCLDELVKIIECKRKRGQIVIPVFYQVSPSDVRKQSGSYYGAFCELEQDSRSSEETVKRWRAALTEAGGLSGWHLLPYSVESELIENIVGDVVRKLDHIYSIDLKGLVGIHRQIAFIESLLCSDSENVQIIGIWGMGGMGKTTISEALFKKLSIQYEGCCFLPNVREEWEKHGQVNLRNKLLSEILGEENLHISTPNLRSTYVMERLKCKRIFVVLDDVQSLKQLEYLTGRKDWFGLGSKIIVTTRDKKVLGKALDQVYEMKGLSFDEAIWLFSITAFEQHKPPTDYLELSRMMVHNANGVPLAIKVLGSFVVGKNKEEWESALMKLKRLPNVEIYNALKLSFNELDEEERDIFLDIACFFKGEKKEYVKTLLDGCGFAADIGIRTLLDKSLLSILDDDILWMHDLIQEMGWQIVRQQCNKEPGKRSRLWDPKDIYHVFKYNTGTDSVEGIFLDMSKIRDIQLSPQSFNRMYNLRYLKFYTTDTKRCNLHLKKGLESLSAELRYLYWERYPLKSLPLNLCTENLVQIQILDSNVEKLWNGVQQFPNLKDMDLTGSRKLVRLPDLCHAPNLESLRLGYCKELVQVPSSIQHLSKLTELDLRYCQKLKIFPDNFQLISLRNLHLWGCSSLKGFPVTGKIEILLLNETAIEELPATIGTLDKLFILDLFSCVNLWSLPSSICKLKFLTEIRLVGCSKLETFPEILEPWESVTHLWLSDTAIKELPSSIEFLIRLKELHLGDCKRLEIIPNSISNLKHLEFLTLSGCDKIDSLPHISDGGLCSLRRLILDNCKNLSDIREDFGCLSSLNDLSLHGSGIVTLPSSIERLSLLVTLNISDCKRLQSLPVLPPLLVNFVASHCTSLKRVSSSRAKLAQIQRKRVDFRDFIFTNCLSLDRNAYCTIIQDAQLRIQRMAKQIATFFPVNFCFPGSEIPKGFHQSIGPSLIFNFPHSDDRFLGFALCVVAAIDGEPPEQFQFNCGVKIHDANFEENITSDYTWLSQRRVFQTDHVFLWYRYSSSRDGFCPGHRLLCEFSSIDVSHNVDFCRVKKCGLCPLYAQEDIDQNIWEQNSEEGTNHGYNYNDEAGPSWTEIDRYAEEEGPYHKMDRSEEAVSCGCIILFLLKAIGRLFKI